MPIFFEPQPQIFKLDTSSTSYVMQVNKYGYLLHLYYGTLIEDTELEYLSYTCSHASQIPRVEMESETNAVPF
jgi:alpha-galactosidase